MTKTDVKNVIDLMNYFKEEKIAVTELQYGSIKIQMTNFGLLQEMDPTKDTTVDGIPRPSGFRDQFRQNIKKVNR